MKKVVLIRHGESAWNKENRFCGWADQDLSEEGVKEAHEAGRRLRENGFQFDIGFSSYLKRAIRTLWIVLEELDQLYIPIRKHWRLNERMYGDLQGKNKSETADQFGEEQVKIWRRSYDVPPPEMSEDNEMYPAKDRKYRKLSPDVIPKTECLKDVVARAISYWEDNIVPRLRNNETVIIAAHGNSLRAIVKYLDNVPDDEIVGFNMPTGIPLVYELDDETLKPTHHYFLASDEEVEAAMNKVKNQGKASH